MQLCEVIDLMSELKRLTLDLSRFAIISGAEFRTSIDPVPRCITHLFPDPYELELIVKTWLMPDKLVLSWNENVTSGRD